MSTPTGQSVRQPLQDRHRSSASRTSVDRQPSVTSSPASISCSSRARPRVECASSPVARNDGHITAGARTTSVVRHLATPTHRRTAAEKSPPSDG
jgi:hypothetical protein